MYSPFFKKRGGQIDYKALAKAHDIEHFGYNQHFQKPVIFVSSRHNLLLCDGLKASVAFYSFNFVFHCHMAGNQEGKIVPSGLAMITSKNV